MPAVSQTVQVLTVLQKQVCKRGNIPFVNIMLVFVQVIYYGYLKFCVSLFWLLLLLFVVSSTASHYLTDAILMCWENTIYWGNTLIASAWRHFQSRDCSDAIPETDIFCHKTLLEFVQILYVTIVQCTLSRGLLLSGHSIESITYLESLTRILLPPGERNRVSVYAVSNNGKESRMTHNI